MAPSAEVTKAVVKVTGGRGFIVEAAGQRLVITCGHCLPELPPRHGAVFAEELPYEDLLSPLDKPKLTVWAECLFADSVADIAVLGGPSHDELCDEREAFEAWTNEVQPLRIAKAENDTPAWLLTLDGRWIRCTVQIRRPWPLFIRDPEEPIVRGMSGSPILNDESAAIGIVGTNQNMPQPRLTANLPGWLLQTSENEFLDMLREDNPGLSEEELMEIYETT